MKQVRVFGTLDFRVREELGGFIPNLQRNVMASVPGSDLWMALSDHVLINDIARMVLDDDFIACYDAGETYVVDEAVAACQNIVVSEAQKQCDQLLSDIDTVAKFLSGLGHECQKSLSIGFLDHTSDGTMVQIEGESEIDSLRSKAFSEAAVRNWIDMIVSAEARTKSGYN